MTGCALTEEGKGTLDRTGGIPGRGHGEAAGAGAGCDHAHREQTTDSPSSYIHQPDAVIEPRPGPVFSYDDGG